MKLISKNFILKIAWMFMALVACTSTAFAGEKVFVMAIRSEIDPTVSRYVKLALEEAQRRNADYVIIDMDTYGGTLSDADHIRKALLEFKKPVYVFINKNAASAGALISIACDKIFMSQGANIGAATVVNSNDGSKAPDKYQSYMRSIMRSTAEANHRNPRIAEAMVDENITVEGINKPGQVITMTTSEAIKHGYCDGQAANIEEVLKLAGVGSYELSSYQLPLTEVIIAFFLNPFVSGILILLIIGGIIFEMKSPGIGFALFTSVVAAVLYFVPYYLNGLAENWEIVLFGVGLVLLALEIFVIPGFGVVGVAGILATFAALVLVMVNNKLFDFSLVQTESLLRAIATAILGLAGGLVLILFAAQHITRTAFYKRAALHDVMDTKLGEELEEMIGMKGIAYTVLRPSGKIIINSKIYSAYTRGNFIDKGEEVEVISQEGNSLKVKQVS